jgi:hypothetical protein
VLQLRANGAELTQSRAGKIRVSTDEEDSVAAPSELEGDGTTDALGAAGDE